MLTRRKLLKLLIKSIFKDGWRSWECVSSKSGKLSDESMSFEIDGQYHIVRLIVLKRGRVVNNDHAQRTA